MIPIVSGGVLIADYLSQNPKKDNTQGVLQKIKERAFQSALEELDTLDFRTREEIILGDFLKGKIFLSQGKFDEADALFLLHITNYDCFLGRCLSALQRKYLEEDVESALVLLDSDIDYIESDTESLKELLKDIKEGIPSPSNLLLELFGVSPELALASPFIADPVRAKVYFDSGIKFQEIGEYEKAYKNFALALDLKISSEKQKLCAEKYFQTAFLVDNPDVETIFYYCLPHLDIEAFLAKCPDRERVEVLIINALQEKKSLFLDIFSKSNGELKELLAQIILDKNIQTSQLNAIHDFLKDKPLGSCYNALSLFEIKASSQEIRALAPPPEETDQRPLAFMLRTFRKHANQRDALAEKMKCALKTERQKRFALVSTFMHKLSTL